MERPVRLSQPMLRASIRISGTSTSISSNVPNIAAMNMKNRDTAQMSAYFFRLYFRMSRTTMALMPPVLSMMEKLPASTSSTTAIRMMFVPSPLPSTSKGAVNQRHTG